MSRIVSLLASATDMIYALGLIDNLVGISHECDYPHQIKKLPVCTKPKFLTDGSSYEINERVKAVLENSLSVYKVDKEILETLQPTHIITQTQCHVCAVSFADLKEITDQTISSNPQIISLKPNSLEDIFNDIQNLGDNLQTGTKARQIVDDYRSQIKAIANSSKKLKSSYKVSLIEWLNPLMISSNWMPELLNMLNLNYNFAKPGQHSQIIQIEQLLDYNPDFIIICPCGFSLDKTINEFPDLLNQPGFKNLTAYQQKNIYLADGNNYFNRPGPRIVETVQILAEIVYGLDYGHLNKSFIKPAI